MYILQVPIAQPRIIYLDFPIFRPLVDQFSLTFPFDHNSKTLTDLNKVLVTYLTKFLEWRAFTYDLHSKRAKIYCYKR